MTANSRPARPSANPPPSITYQVRIRKYDVTEIPQTTIAIHLLLTNHPNKMFCQSCRAMLRTQRLSALRAPPRQTALRAHRLPPSQALCQRPFSSSSSRPNSATAIPSSPAEELPSMNPAESAIAELLAAKLEPTQLLVQDVSGGCGSMYAIDITAAAFRGQSILKQQRMVNSALGDAMKAWHGVQIRTSVPEDS